MQPPGGISINVVENTGDTVHITLPSAPLGQLDLSDDEQADAAGGMDAI